MEQALFSSEKQDWKTPYDKFLDWHKEFNFQCDPCTTSDNPLKLQYIYTKEINGLTHFWAKRNFINPPYNDQLSWIKWGNAQIFDYKCVDLNVYLLPARTDTKMFHEYIYNRPNVEIRFLKGRLKFVGAKSSAPFPSMLVIVRKA